MSVFLDIALRNAARGFRVHPLRGKDAFLKDWPNLATTDETQIREWARAYDFVRMRLPLGCESMAAKIPFIESMNDDWLLILAS